MRNLLTLLFICFIIALIDPGLMFALVFLIGSATGILLGLNLLLKILGGFKF